MSKLKDTLTSFFLWWQLLDCDEERMVAWLMDVCGVGEWHAGNRTAGQEEKLETTQFLTL